MTFQEAANKIITEAGSPLPPNQVACIAFAEGLVKSRAKDPTRSFAETIKKNIRGRNYNKPELYIFNTHQGKFIGLSNHKKVIAYKLF